MTFAQGSASALSDVETDDDAADCKVRPSATCDRSACVFTSESKGIESQHQREWDDPVPGHFLDRETYAHVGVQMKLSRELLLVAPSAARVRGRGPDCEAT
jgi:hypothetical protein